MYRVRAPSDAREILGAALRGGFRGGADRPDAFLGPRVVVERGGYLSLDGARRIRLSPQDRFARFEWLDPALGVTRRSELRRCAFRMGPEPPVESRRSHARVVGRGLIPVCFDRRGRSPSVSLVRLIERGEGVLVVRIAADGSTVGDTWHEDPAAARAQLTQEFGGHIGPLRAGPGVLGTRRAPAWLGCVVGRAHTF